MTKDEVLKLALEALESKFLFIAGDGEAVDQRAKAITAIKEALAQPEQEPVVWMYVNKSTHEVRFQKHMRDFVDHGAFSEVPLFSEPLANQEKTSGSLMHQKPVAWSYWQSCLNDDGTQTAPWVHRLSKFQPSESIINKDITPLYTTPPQRKPLTDECQQAIRLAIKGYFDDAYVYGDELYSKIIDALAAHGIKGEA